MLAHDLAQPYKQPQRCASTSRCIETGHFIMADQSGDRSIGTGVGVGGQWPLGRYPALPILRRTLASRVFVRYQIQQMPKDIRGLGSDASSCKMARRK
jgi:hypothetical protein